MKGLDTNVILSWLFDEGNSARLDDPQYLIGDVALAELVWVLRSSFGKKPAEIAKVIEKMLGTSTFAFRNRQSVELAYADFTRGQADFPDYLLMRINEESLVETTLTLDKKAARHPGFTRLKAN